MTSSTTTSTGHAVVAFGGAWGTIYGMLITTSGITNGQLEEIPFGIVVFVIGLGAMSYGLSRLADSSSSQEARQ